MEDHNKYICYGLVMVLLTGKSIPLGKFNAERHTSENLAMFQNVESLHGICSVGSIENLLEFENKVGDAPRIKTICKDSTFQILLCGPL